MFGLYYPIARQDSTNIADMASSGKAKANGRANAKVDSHEEEAHGYEFLGP